MWTEPSIKAEAQWHLARVGQQPNGFPPIVTISNNANNGFNTTNFNLARDRTFTISVADDYFIVGYKIYTPAGWGTTVTTEAGESAVFSGEQTLTILNLNTKSTSFSTADANLNDPTIEVYIVDDATAVGIGEIPSKGTGQVLGLYSIDGRRLSKVPAKGVYIGNGKKILVK